MDNNYLKNNLNILTDEFDSVVRNIRSFINFNCSNCEKDFEKKMRIIDEENIFNTNGFLNTRSLSNLFNSNILNMMILINFDCSDCKKDFEKKIKIIGNNEKNFFDIYGFLNFNLESDIFTMLENWNNLKKQIETEDTIYFKIFLSVYKINQSIEVSKAIQFLIIDAICKILSNIELKEIYDEYYLDWNIRNMQTNKDKIIKNIKNIKLMDVVYSNIFENPLILNEKANVVDLENHFKIVCSTYEPDKDYKTKEELDKLYNILNKPFESEKITFEMAEIKNKKHREKIQKFKQDMEIHINQIANPQINHNCMNFLFELVNKYRITDVNNLINFYNLKKSSLYKSIVDSLSTCDSTYDFTNFVDVNDDDNEKTFIENFNYDEFENWIISYSNSKSNNKNKNLLETKYLQLVKDRKNQNMGIKKYFDLDRLNYFARKTFTLPQLWNECDYQMANDDLISKYIENI